MAVPVGLNRRYRARESGRVYTEDGGELWPVETNPITVETLLGGIQVTGQTPSVGISNFVITETPTGILSVSGLIPVFDSQPVAVLTPPTIAVTTITHSSVTVSITGGEGITSITPQYREDGSGTWLSNTPFSPGPSSYQYTGLDPETEYEFRFEVTDGDATDHSNVVEAETGAASDEPYPLGDIPFEYAWPTEPNITSSATVTAATFSANNVNGREITLTNGAGAYGSLTISGTDKRLVIGEDVEIAGLNITGQRIHIVGGPPRMHVIKTISTGGSASSIFFEDLFIMGDTDTPNMWDHQNTFLGDHIALLRCYVDSPFHSFFVQGTPGLEYVIIARCFFNQHRPHDEQTVTQAGPRVHNSRYCVLVDNRFRNQNDTFANNSRHSLRIHAPADNSNSQWWVVRRNQFVGSGIQVRPNSGPGVGANAEMRDIWIEDNDWYHNHNNVMHIGTGTQEDPYPTHVRFNNNRVRSTVGGSFPSAPGGQNWESSGNQSGLTYAAPPPWTWYDDDYTLDDIGTVPFDYDTPEPPALTSEQYVTPANIGTFAANNRRIVLQAGNYGNLTLSGTDREYVLMRGVVIDTLTISGTRIYLTADPFRVGTINRFGFGSSNGPADIFINGIYTDSTDLTDERNLISGNRIAVINSRMRTKDFVLGSFPTNSSGPNDIIIANNNLMAYGSTQAGIRWQNVVRMVFVDNRAEKTGSTHHTFRLHAPNTGQKMDEIYVSRNQFEGPAFQIRPIPGGIGSGDPNSGMGEVHLVDNQIYYNGAWTIAFGTQQDQDFPETFICTGNDMYRSSGSWPSQGQFSWDATISGNTTNSYQAPPSWEFK